MTRPATPRETDDPMERHMHPDEDQNRHDRARWCRAAWTRSAVTLALACLSLLAGAAPANAAIGERFGFAPVSKAGTDAPAFPHGPEARAWWAGVCDLHAGSATVGILPVTRHPNCIDHPAVPESPDVLNQQSGIVLPPLADGAQVGTSGPDGWWSEQQGLTSGPSWRLTNVAAAGGRPDGSASFWFARSEDSPLGVQAIKAGPDGAPRNIRVSLPPGVVANPNAVPKCPAEAATVVPTRCPPKTQVGVATISVDQKTSVNPVYNVQPRDGRPAELIISQAGIFAGNNTNVPVLGDVRTDGDFGVDGFAVDLPAALTLHGQTMTLWGVPWARSHDRYRPVASYCGAPGDGTVAWMTFGMPVSGLPGGFGGHRGGCSQEPQSYDPSWGPIRPFLTTQTECSPQNPVTRIHATNWHTPQEAREDSVAPLVTGCEDVPFGASFEMGATTGVADAASGLGVALRIAQNNDPPAAAKFNPDDDDAASAVAHWKSPAGRATSHLQDSVVTLPQGFSVNPSAATGLDGCSDAGMGVTDASSDPLRFNDGDPLNKDNGADGAECPDGSVIGIARVTTPLLDEELTGQVVLGTPETTNPEGEADGRRMLRMFIVVRNKLRGLVAKVHGTATLDPVSGKIEATFANNPRVPFDLLELDFKGGQRGVLATPQRCASNDWASTFTPWSGGTAVSQTGQFPTNTNCGFGFVPSLAAGMDTQAARANGSFSFRFARRDGEQWLGGLTAKLPEGLLASVKGLPLCSNAQADVGACPAGSKIGIVDAKAGSGDPFVLEDKGEVFLTEGYKGGAYGLAVKVRPVAGPFRGEMELSPIVVRQAIHVDPITAQVTAVSDPFPLIHHGVPLRVREVTVLVDRDRFMLNPSDCDPSRVGADLLSAEGATHNAANPFNTAGCGELAFKPNLTLALSGRKQVTTGKHPGIRAQVTQQGIDEAGIEKAEVRLPKSLALDVNNAQALCEYADGTKPDLDKHCPKGSIVGRARATSPLLDRPLAGNVYFVKNVRKDPKTGNEIRTLPMIIVALRGEIAINLKGESDTTKSGKLVSTFNQVPDAPVTQFNLNITGGRNGILAVTRTRRAKINLCAQPNSHIAESDIDGHNGRRHDTDIRMKTPCTKKQTRAAKRQAKRAAAKARH